MAEVILMPRLSDTMTEGVIASWHKKVGDPVKKGDLLAEVETDKATMDLESYKDGTLLYTGTDKGGKIQVNDLLAIIGAPGEDITALVKGGGAAAAGGAGFCRHPTLSAAQGRSFPAGGQQEPASTPPFNCRTGKRASSTSAPMKRAARFAIRANQASRKFLQRSISGRIGSKGQRYVRLAAAAACGCVSDVFWATAMLISRQFMASF